MYVTDEQFLRDFTKDIVAHAGNRLEIIAGNVSTLRAMRVAPINQAIEIVRTASSLDDALATLNGFREYAQAGVHELPEV